MKCYFKLILSIIVLRIASFSAISQVVITVQTDSVINKMVAGFGTNTFAMLDSVPVVMDNKGGYRSWGGSAWGATPEASDEKAWAKIYSYMDWLGMDYTRLNLEHRMFEPERGKYSFDNREMLVFYKYLDYFEKNGVTVQLQEMYPNVKWLTHSELQSDAVGVIKSGPSDIEAWSNGMIALLKHLLIDKKYTCIQYLGIANEPHHGWSWWKEADGRTSQSIIPALTLLRSKIQKEKIPVLITGPEEMFYFWEVKDSQTKYTNLVDAFTYHEYMTINDWWDNRENKDWNPTLKLFTEPVKTAVKIAHDNNKPFFFSEHGTMQFGLTRDDRGPSMHAAVLKDVEFAVRYSNLGVDGFSRWSLLNRNNLDGQWGFIETFDRKTMKLLDPGKYYPKENTFYGYGMLTRFIYRKSAVVKSNIDNYFPEDSISALHVAAYVSPKKTHTTIVIVNDKQETTNATIAIQGKENYETWYKYRFSYNQRNRNDVQINPLIEVIGKKIEDRIPGLSITVYSTKKLLDSDKGLVNE